jgi:hypothetical protein
MSNQLTTLSLTSWALSPLYGLFRTANEAAKLGEDCTKKVFVVTGAYSGLGVYVSFNT